MDGASSPPDRKAPMSTTKTVDARGLSCPQPVMLARQALEQLEGGTVEVLVDIETAMDSVVRLAEMTGWRAAVEQRPDGSFRLVLTR